MPVKWTTIIVFIFIMGLSFYLFYPKIENFFVFFPQSPFDFTPEEYKLSYRDVYFNTEDGFRLHGWFFPLEKGSPVILFCHGNAGNISHRLDNISRLIGQNLQVFIFDYRGYGKSSGRPSEKGVYKDGLAAYAYLVQQENLHSDNIILFGRSLGAAVAIEVALRKKVRSLIIESAFTSTKEMAKTMPLFFPFSPLLPAHYNNLTKIPLLNMPKLIIHGERDEIVPFTMGERLWEAAKDPKYFLPIKGAGHNDTYLLGGKRYFQIISSFVRFGKI
ncbi:MAG: alpha/beta hydrolase [Pseudomonadota bacterium]